MKTGTLFFRVVARKLQASGRAVQYILLAGFEPKLVQATAAYYETLTPADKLVQADIDAGVNKLKAHSSAEETCDVTDGTTLKKLSKTLEMNQYGFIS